MEPADIMTTEAVAGGMQCVSAHDTRAVAAGVMAQKPSGPMPTTPVQKVEVERLPDLNTARSGHAVICVDGEVTVFGGHTTNFVPAATAEYYGDGGWHEMPMAYVHDNGFAVAHSSGRVLLGGGHEQYLGIGQTFVTEWYDPSEHSFQGFGGLAVKRVLATAVELDGGRVVVAGNHYHDDAVELFDGKGTFTKVKDVVAPHCSPHILRTSADNAIIFGCRDTYSHADSRPIVEPLQGQPYEEPLLCRWHPIGRESTINDECGFVGDAAAGDFTYIIPAVDSCGQLAMLRVQGGSFSLLPTATPIPMQGLGGSIVYEHAIVADTCARRAYVHGYDSDGHHYLLRIDYADTLRGAAPLTLYYTDPLPWAGMQIPVVLPSGDLLVAGGFTGNNFEPSAAVYIFKVGQEDDAASCCASHWAWTLAAAAVLLLLLVGYRLHKSRKASATHETHTAHEAHAPYNAPDSPAIPDSPNTTDTTAPPLTSHYAQICALMEEQQLFQRSDLKVSDVAALLGTNTSYVSQSIKAGRGCTFPQFVNLYRVAYAKRLMKEQPDIKMLALSEASGFANETSFFRTFRAIEGVTPKEMMARNG